MARIDESVGIAANVMVVFNANDTSSLGWVLDINSIIHLIRNFTQLIAITVIPIKVYICTSV